MPPSFRTRPCFAKICVVRRKTPSSRIILPFLRKTSHRRISAVLRRVRNFRLLRNEKASVFHPPFRLPKTLPFLSEGVFFFFFFFSLLKRKQEDNCKGMPLSSRNFPSERRKASGTEKYIRSRENASEAKSGAFFFLSFLIFSHDSRSPSFHGWNAKEEEGIPLSSA